jgi:hypothetical protein
MLGFAGQQRRAAARAAEDARRPLGPAPPGGHPAPPDSPAARAKSGRRRRRRRRGRGRRRQTPGSAIPCCPGWGETAAAHFLSNPAQRPTSLATGVNFKNFISTQAIDRAGPRGGAERGQCVMALMGPLHRSES